MSDTVIRVEGLGKRYRLRHLGQGDRQFGYVTLRDVLADKARALFGGKTAGGQTPGSQPQTPDRTPRSDEDFWALQDVSFEVKQGERVGIIGRNGAGKSTLLKILSRITEPTRGRVRLRGRVASLLEVGTGFHPELTGRENIYLNGAILGMSRHEIRRKFDEIVAFAEVEKFLDTPVKRYSSGMYVRLAFAVAAHLEPEILIVDEVLAVGDIQFQKKCLGKMQDVAEREGRTVLFVSHNMAAVSRLCSRGILLESGHVVLDASATEVVGRYVGAGGDIAGERVWPDPEKAPGNDIVRLRSLSVRTEDDQIAATVDIRRRVGIQICFEVLLPGHVLVPNFHFFNEEGVYVFAVSDCDPAWHRKPRPVGAYTTTAWIPGNFLAEGTHFVSVAVSTMIPVKVHFYERDALTFRVVDPMEGDSARGDYAGRYPGVVRPKLDWTTRFEPAARSPARGELVETHW